MRSSQLSNSHCRRPSIRGCVLHCHNPIELTATTAKRGAKASSIGHFELMESLGSGQYGTVLNPRDTQLDRTAAVTILRSDQLHQAETAETHDDFRPEGPRSHPIEA